MVVVGTGFSMDFTSRYPKNWGLDSNTEQTHKVIASFGLMTLEIQQNQNTYGSKHIGLPKPQNF
jgi:hypothetical protein